jgi:hypothetical protein
MSRCPPLPRFLGKTVTLSTPPSMNHQAKAVAGTEQQRQQQQQQQQQQEQNSNGSSSSSSSGNSSSSSSSSSSIVCHFTPICATFAMKTITKSVWIVDQGIRRRCKQHHRQSNEAGSSKQQTSKKGAKVVRLGRNSNPNRFDFKANMLPTDPLKLHIRICFPIEVLIDYDYEYEIGLDLFVATSLRYHHLPSLPLPSSPPSLRCHLPSSANSKQASKQLL